MKQIWIGSDHAGFEMKQTIYRSLLSDKTLEVFDVGCYSNDSCDYPEFAKSVCENVINKGGFGILVCGSGQGMCMTANKFPEIRAALIHDLNSAKLSREHNNANVMCLGARNLNTQDAIEWCNVFINTPNSKEERHLRRINKITTNSDN